MDGISKFPESFDASFFFIRWFVSIITLGWTVSIYLDRWESVWLEATSDDSCASLRFGFFSTVNRYETTCEIPIPMPIPYPPAGFGMSHHWIFLSI